MAQVNKRTAAAKKQAEQKKEQKADVRALLLSYQKIKDEPAFKDLLKNVNDFARYHVKLAQDGVGFKYGKDGDGKPVTTEVAFTPEQRTGHLDKAAGQQEIIDFVERKLAATLPKESDGPSA